MTVPDEHVPPGTNNPLLDALLHGAQPQRRTVEELAESPPLDDLRAAWLMRQR